jgi:Na+/melibiose symporter-like transporter
LDASFFSSWPFAVVAVIALAAATIGFALLIGRWIDAQSNTVVDAPKDERRRKNRDNPPGPQA